MIIIENILFMLFYICYFILYFEIFVYENHFHKIPGFQHFFFQNPGHFQVHFKFQVISRSTRHPVIVRSRVGIKNAQTFYFSKKYFWQYLSTVQI